MLEASVSLKRLEYRAQAAPERLGLSSVACVLIGRYLFSPSLECIVPTVVGSRRHSNVSFSAGAR